MNEDRLKYRVWDKISKTMHDVKEVSFDYHRIVVERAKRTIVQGGVVCFSGLDKFLSFKNTVLMQCTGLRSKDGILIYEHDIISHPWSGKPYEHEVMFVVRWQNGAYLAVPVISFVDGNPVWPCALYYDWEFDGEEGLSFVSREMIPYSFRGNIYENEDLIRGLGQE